MTVTRYGFEDLAHGTTLTPGGIYTTVSAAAGTLKADTDSAVNGIMGVEALRSADGQIVYATAAHTAVAAITRALIYLQPPTNPTSTQQRVSEVRHGGISMLRLDQHTNGCMLVRDAAGASNYNLCPSTTDPVPPAGTPVLWQLYIEPVGGYVYSKFTRLDTMAVLKDSGLVSGVNVSTATLVDASTVGWSIGSKAGVTAFAWDDFAIDTAPASRGALIEAWIDEANAGSDQIRDPWEEVTLTGTGTGTWTQVSGTTVSPAPGAGSVFTFIAPPSMEALPQDLVFDYGGDTVTVTVRPATLGKWETDHWTPIYLNR